MSIKIKKIDNDNFHVTVKKTFTTEHKVTLTDKYSLFLNKKKSKIEIIEDSFIFLLKKEENTSILPEFNIKIINDFFSDYESKLRNE